MYAIEIAASVPTLRPLFLWATGKSYRSHSANKYHSYGNERSHYGMSALRSHQSRKNDNGDTSTGGCPSAHISRILGAGGKEDENGSDRSILHAGDIQKTTEVNVTYGDASTRVAKVEDWEIAQGKRGVNPEDKV